MATSTYKTFLMVKKAGTTPAFEKLIDIKDYPDLGGEPESLETTTLSDSMQTFIKGIQSSESMGFTANYTLEDYKRLVALGDKTQTFSVWFGGTDKDGVVTPTGEYGKFTFDGEISVFLPGKGVNEVVEMSISILPCTPIVLS